MPSLDPLRATQVVAVTPAGSPLPPVVQQLGLDVLYRWPDPDHVVGIPGSFVVIVDATKAPAEMLKFVKELRRRDEDVPIVGIFGEFGLLSLTPAQGLTDFVISDAGARELRLRLERAVARPTRPTRRMGADTIERSAHGVPDPDQARSGRRHHRHRARGGLSVAAAAIGRTGPRGRLTA